MRRHCVSACLLLLSVVSYAQGAPEAAPGLRIPSGARPWALDEYQGKKQLVPIHSTAVQPNNHKGSNVAGGLLAGPFYKAKFTTEIDGKSAATAVHTGQPVFYVRTGSEADAGTSMVAGWAVVHAVAENSRRLLSTVQFTQLTGNAKRSSAQVEVMMESLPGGWIRITPKEALAPGEYALQPVMRQANAFSTVVYDFRVDPLAENDADVVTATPE